VAAFISILIYALVAGNPKEVISIHNFSGKACYQQTNNTCIYLINQVGYFPIPGTTENAMCVK
jgi:hypothetical protein